MDFRKKIKGFFTLTRRANGGFTLVELIVVIAILAILAGVGIPVYSGYITKANKQADMTLASEVAQALTLAYYNQKLPEGGYVILSADGATTSGTDVTDALIAAFGTKEDGTPNVAGLKHDGWAANYDGSSFYGAEVELLSKVDTLTDKLAGALNAFPSLAGNNFTNYVSGLGISADDPKYQAKMADAAVLYVAKNTSGRDTDAMVQTILALPNNATNAQAALKYLNTGFGTTLNSAAALYAVAEGFCRYQDASLTANGEEAKYQTILDTATGNIAVNPDADDTKEEVQENAFEQIFDAFGQIMAEADETAINDYFTNQAKKDALAYIDILDVVSGAEATIADKVVTGEANSFNSSEIQAIFSAYSGGGIVVFAEFQEDGTLMVKSTIDE